MTVPDDNVNGTDGDVTASDDDVTGTDRDVTASDDKVNGTDGDVIATSETLSPQSILAGIIGIEFVSVNGSPPLPDI